MEMTNAGTGSGFRVIDIHAHVVYGLDDGSKSIELSEEMLRKQSEQGVTDVFCTSHSWGKWDYYWDNLETLRALVREKQLNIRLHSGCEVACSQEILFTEVLPYLNEKRRPPFAESRYVLVEFLPKIPKEELIYCLNVIDAETDYTPVIAHAERYERFQYDAEAYHEMTALQFPIQINACSLVEDQDEGVRKLARRLLKDKRALFLGSDGHGIDRRPPNLKSGVEYIYANCEKSYAEGVCYRNAENELLGLRK